MPISEYLRGLRARVGHDLLLVPGVGALVHDDTGRLLLAVRSDTGALEVPGGAIDPGEGPRAAVCREVREETGLLVEPTHLVGVVGPFPAVYPNGDRVEYTTTVWWCEVAGGVLAPLDGECSDFYWVEPDRVPPVGLPPAVFAWRPGMPPVVS